MRDNPFGKTSVLSIKTAYKDKKTILADCYFTPPFKIAKPFYNEAEMKLVLMSASAGIMEGDTQEVRLELGENTDVYFTSQSYEKVHKMETGFARRETDIYIGKEAYLKYVPLSTIPFAGSAFKNKLYIELEDDSSRLFLAEIISSGREGFGERFLYRYYRSQIELRKKGQLIYRDNTYYEPENMDLNGFGMFEGYTHLVNLVLVGNRESGSLLEEIREILRSCEALEGGASLGENNVINVKALGRSAQRMEEFIEKINRIIK